MTSMNCSPGFQVRFSLGRRESRAGEDRRRPLAGAETGERQHGNIVVLAKADGAILSSDQY